MVQGRYCKVYLVLADDSKVYYRIFESKAHFCDFIRLRALKQDRHLTDAVSATLRTFTGACEYAVDCVFFRMKEVKICQGRKELANHRLNPNEKLAMFFRAIYAGRPLPKWVEDTLP